ncbi:MAG TPA: DUF4398 domain-containing protein [Marinobacter sp.]|nr:DUF4398 domain-containing protein [Marinobacter sp.]
MNSLTIRKVAERVGLTITLILSVLTLVACASAPLPPTESLSAAKTAIASAEQADARQHAGAELEEANRQLVEAEQAVADKRMVEADQLAKQARVAAELAIARTEAKKAASINREMDRGTEALDEEMQRQGDQK